jgi:hypothetical protein
MYSRSAVCLNQAFSPQFSTRHMVKEYVQLWVEAMVKEGAVSLQTCSWNRLFVVLEPIKAIDHLFRCAQTYEDQDTPQQNLWPAKRGRGHQ